MLQKLFKLKNCEWFSQRYWYNTVSYSIHWSFDFKRNICSTLYVHCTLSMKFLNFSFFSTFFLPPLIFPKFSDGSPRNLFLAPLWSRNGAFLEKMCSTVFFGGGVREFLRTMPKHANLHDFSAMLWASMCSILLCECSNVIWILKLCSEQSNYA